MIQSGGKCLFAVLVCLAATNSAKAQWRIHDLNPLNPCAGANKALREFDKKRLNKMAPGFRAGRDYTKVYIRNKSKTPIWVAIIDIPFVIHQGNETTIDDPSPDNSPFRVHAWYKLDPNERQHVSNTSNRNVYFYAQNNMGRFWQGKVTHAVPDGDKTRYVGFVKESFDKTPEEHTINFNP